MNHNIRTAGIIIAMVLLAGIASGTTAVLAIDQGIQSIQIQAPDEHPMDGAAWARVFNSINDESTVRAYQHQGFQYYWQRGDAKAPVLITDAYLIPVIVQGGSATLIEQEAVASLNGPGAPVEWYSLSAIVHSIFG
jgi:hypothetical protein